MNIKTSFIIDTYKKIKHNLPNYVLNSIIKLIPIYLISSVFEIFGLVVLFPIVKVVIQPSYIKNNTYASFLYESFHFQSNVGFVLFLFCFITAVFILKNLIILFITKVQTKVAFNLASQLSFEKYTSYLNKPYGFHSGRNTAVLLRNFTQMPFELIQYVVMPFIAILSELFILALIICAITIYDPILFWSLILFTVPFLFLYNSIYKKKLEDISKKRDEEGVNMFKLGLQSMEAYREMIVFDKKEFFKPQYKSTVDSYSKSMSDIYVMNSFSSKIVETVAVIAIFSIFISGYLLNKDLSTLSQFLIIFTIAAYRVIPSMNKIILSANYIKSSSQVFQYFNRADFEEIETINPINLKNETILFNEKLEIRDLSFKYKTGVDTILNNINLNIPVGHTIGIIGTSGAGKTTLLNILLRLYEETKGGIYVDGVKIENSNLHLWYKLVSYVPQNPTLLDSSIIANIAFGIPLADVDYNLLKRVIEQSQLQSFVEKLENGINTEIGEKGIKISGGQRQRIAIARALYHGGKILIFDEATSSLDIETEQMLTEAINNITHKDLTIIIVAHRIQTLKYCDAIYKLDSGEIGSKPLSYNDILNNN